MSEEAVTVLRHGDRLLGRPCDVTIVRLHPLRTSALGYCETCDDHHVINRTMFEAGEGPWRRAENGTSEGSDD